MQLSELKIGDKFKFGTGNTPVFEFKGKTVIDNTEGYIYEYVEHIHDKYGIYHSNTKTRRSLMDHKVIKINNKKVKKPPAITNDGNKPLQK